MEGQHGVDVLMSDLVNVVKCFPLNSSWLFTLRARSHGRKTGDDDGWSAQSVDPKFGASPHGDR